MISIFELLENKANARVLRLFLENPTGSAYAAQLIKKVKVSRKPLFDALAALNAAGLLKVEAIGRVKKYHLADTAATRQLRIMLALDKLAGLADILEGEGAKTYLYGSAARGENTEQSDLDVLVISEKPKSAVAGKLESRLQNKVKLLIMTPLEYALAAKKDPAFYSRMEADKIEL